MPYCSKCGSVLNADDMFCSGCGSRVNGDKSKDLTTVSEKASPIAIQEKTRTESIEEMNRMIQYFGQKQQQYDEYDDCVEKINYYSNPNSIVKVSGNRGTTQITIGIVMVCLTLFFGGFPALFSLFALGGSYDISSPLAILFFFTAFMVGGVVLVVLGVSKNSEYSRLVRQERANLLSKYDERLTELANELQIHYKKYGYCATGPSYTNPKILSKLNELLALGRADTIKEAINLMHQEAHNAEMELQAAMTARSAESAARGANTAAFFTAANFFLK